jgi:S-disulfanyl-L-cysteine oxidoreductase SoxD
MSKRIVGGAIVVALAAVAAGVGISWGAEAGRTVWDGIYTEAQAARGQAVLTEQCVLCHGETMRGGGGVPSAVGPEFMFNWKDKSVAELFAYLKMMMPPTAPGSLSDQKYADVMALLFKMNGFPASEGNDIPANPDALPDVRITPDKP